jgi:hypothetical protein
VLVKPGDEVAAGDPLLILHTEDAERLTRAYAELGSLDEPGGALTLGPRDRPDLVQPGLPLIMDVIESA